MRNSTAPRNQAAFAALYLTGPQIADELGVSRSSLQLWVRFGEFPQPDAQAGNCLLWERTRAEAGIAAIRAARANPVVDVVTVAAGGTTELAA